MVQPPFEDGFGTLCEDRVQKGFNVVQIVAGLYPDMPAFDPRGANEAGFPWTKDYRSIRPEYFDAADKRIQRLVDSGLTPCIVGAWGYHLPWLGVERMKKHWRYVVARWGALPVVWCVAGEITMPFYLSKTKEKDSEFQREGWTEVAKELHRVDPFHRLVTGHPSRSARFAFSDPSVLDFDMLQTGHGDRGSIPNTIRLVRGSRAAWPILPVVNGEVTYEGILNTCFEDVQRFMVWSCFLSGTAGHTYGANGIWQVNQAHEPYGKSPHGGNWGNRPWDDAMQLPGSRQVGLAKGLLERYAWWNFEPHPEWATWKGGNAGHKEYEVPYSAGIADKVRITFIPGPGPIVLHDLDRAGFYRLRRFDPRTGAMGPPEGVHADRHGNFALRVAVFGRADGDAGLGGGARAGRRASGRRSACIRTIRVTFCSATGRLCSIAASEHYGSVINRAFDFERVPDRRRRQAPDDDADVFAVPRAAVGPQSVFAVQAGVARFCDSLAADGAGQGD